MSVGKSSLARAAEFAAKSNENQQKTTKPRTRTVASGTDARSSVPSPIEKPKTPKRRKQTVQKPGSDIEALPTEVMSFPPASEIPPATELPAEIPFPHHEVTDPPSEKPYFTPGDDLPPYLL